MTKMSLKDKEGIFIKLLKKKTALFSILFLGLLFFLSIFAYLIITDNTPDSNNQQLEIALKAPGFRTDIILAPKPDKKNSNIFQRLVYGSPSLNDELPFKTITELDGTYRIVSHIDRQKFIIKKHTTITNRTYWLGTDKFGRDILSRLILGVRISLVIGLMAVCISLMIGITIGAMGGYFGGWVDKTVMYFINITWSIPTLLLVFAIVIAFGRGFYIIFLAVGLTLWVDVARLVRGQVLKIKEEEFITAARSLSYSPFRVIRKHIIPNIIGPLLVIAATNFAVAILIEAGLSYLGFGIQPPAPSVGNMLNENYGYAISGKPFLAIIPALTIMMMVLAFNLIGSGLRDILDVKTID